MTKLTVLEVIALLRNETGLGIYLRRRQGERRLSLWATSTRYGVGAMNRDRLSNMLDDRGVENPYTLATALMAHEFKGDEFPVIEDSAVDLVATPPGGPT